ncbi:MAG: alanine dehydrogenase [Prochlorococcaceae cyanobacterium]
MAMPDPAAPMASIGVPAEIKRDERRVALTPDGVRELVSQGMEVRIQEGAGLGAGIGDDGYHGAGARIVGQEEAWAAHLVVKVKEPQPEEFRFLRPDLVLFTYLHLAAYPEVGRALLEAGTTALAYETVQLDDGSLPLLAPMSEVAGRIATQVGAHLLEKPHGGRGVLIGGCTGVAPARVVVLGAGTVGWNAARIAAAMDAEVLLLDKSPERLRALEPQRQGRMVSLVSSDALLQRLVPTADLLIGAVLVAGGRAPTLVGEPLVQQMRAGSVIVDVAIDQGGCVETMRETTHVDPVYEMHGVVHYAVGNMPGAVPHTSTYALTNATLPYQLSVAVHGARGAATADPAIALGVNTVGGKMTNKPSAEALSLDFVEPLTALQG